MQNRCGRSKVEILKSNARAGMRSYARAFVLTIIALVSLFATMSAEADEDTTLVPIDKIEAPAVDLVYNGKQIDLDQAVALRKKGVDLSLLEPVANDMFGRAPADGAASPISTTQMPIEGATIDYDSALAGFGREMSIHRVVSGPDAFRLTVSTVPHRALLTRALLSRMGYNQYQPRRYKRLAMRFASIEKRQEFVDTIALNTVKEPATWIVDSPAIEPILVLRDVVLEPGRIDVQNYYWAALPSGFSENRRALRALLVPIALCNAPENIDSYSWDFDRILSRSLFVSYPHEIENQRPFDDSTIDDIRWAARKIAPLTAADWKSIVAAADYPADIAELVLQKMMAKRNQLLSSAGIKAPLLAVNLHLNNSSVTNGQVSRAHFEGYASRFTYGDAEDPMRPTELANFGIMEAVTSGMETLAAQVSKQLQILTLDSAKLQHQRAMIGDFIRHIVANPDQPYSAPITTWGGPTAGFGLQASRQLATGTAYGSSAPIQLVDTIGLTASVGYFRGLDGIKNLFPSIRADLSVGRNYTHLRSLASIGDALKVPAADFLVPKMLHDLSVVLAQKAKTPGAEGATYSAAIEDLLSQIKDGEMFTITDSVIAGPSASVTIPLQALFPALPVGYNQGITFGAGLQGLVLKRTTIRRVNDLASGANFLQVYVQSMSSVTGNLTLDFNYYVNIAHFGIEKSVGKARTRVYTVKSDAGRTEKTSVVLASSLRALLSTNSDSKLRSNYPFYLLNHDLDESDWQMRFMFFQAKDMTERHVLRIQPPTDDEHPFNPKAYERTFYAYRTVARTGLNYMSFLSSIFGAVTEGQAQIEAGSSDNPAYSPYGSAHWTEMYSDAEITKGADYTPVTIARETYAGWSIDRDGLFEIFDQIDARLTDMRHAGLKISLIHRSAFASTQKLEFYNITSSTIFYPKGVNRLVRPLMASTSGTAYSPNYREQGSADAFSPGDRYAYETIMSWMGGEMAYITACEQQRRGGGAGGNNARAYEQIVYGNTYVCVDAVAQAVLDLRRERPSTSDKKAFIEWQTKLIAALVQGVPTMRLLNVAQKDGFFMQVSVKGFRKGDHQAKDSEDKELIASYTSDSLGTVDQYAGAGAFSTLADKTGITSFEINGMFFTGGD